MNIKDSVVLVTGANRGLGRRIAELALERGARRVYACARHPEQVNIPGATPLKLDVTDLDDTRRAALLATDVSLVINNAGVLAVGGVASHADLDGLRRQMETNLFGTINVNQAFVPILKGNGGGAVVNVLSALSWLGVASMGGYSVSKAAAWMMTNALRNEIRAQGTLVVGLHAGFIDTEMAAGFPGAKVSPSDVVNQAYDAVEAGREEVLADQSARQVQAALSSGIYLQSLKF